MTGSFQRLIELMDPVPPATLSRRELDSHKGNFGRLLFIGGSRGMAGSIAMSAMAALRSGAGLVTVATPSACLDTVAGYHPSYMTIPLKDDKEGRLAPLPANFFAELSSQYDVIGCGPGLSDSEGAQEAVRQMISLSEPLRVLDADALNVLARMPGDLKSYLDTAGAIVLTPHPKEMERLTGVSSGDRRGQIRVAELFSQSNQAVWVLKGAPTVVIANGLLWTNDTGNPGMATGGSGDVLTGIITALIGQGMSPWDAARVGVWVHGRTGDLAAQKHGYASLISTDLINYLSRAMRELENF